MRIQNLVNDDTVQSWGILAGPAIVQVALVPGRDFPAPHRVMPLIAPAFTGARTGAAANAVRSASLGMVQTDGGEDRPPSIPSWWGGQTMPRWWPRVRVSWPTWSPALWVDPSALGQLWIAYYSVTFEEGVSGELIVGGGVQAIRYTFPPSARVVAEMARRRERAFAAVGGTGFGL